LLTSSPLTGLIAGPDVSGLEAGEFCWEAGLLGWLAGGCCARSGKLVAMANRVVTSAVPVFMKILRRFLHCRIRTHGGAVTRFQIPRKRRAKLRISAQIASKG
jgi:hypothetical protein